MPYKDKEKQREYGINLRKTEEWKTYQREYRREWRKKFPDKDKEYRKKEIHSTKRREGINRWRNENRDKYNNILKKFRHSGKAKEYEKKKIKEDKNYASRKRLRTLLNEALKKYSIGKKLHSNQYGINYKDILEHLKPFPDNISDYHIDHIKPLCSFDLTNLEEVKKAFAPENHRWLLAKDNLAKSSEDRKISLKRNKKEVNNENN